VALLGMVVHGVQILRVFRDSAGSLDGLKEDLGAARKLLGARHKLLQQQWSRSVTLRHVISLLDQIDKVAQVGDIGFLSKSVSPLVEEMPALDLLVFKSSSHIISRVLGTISSGQFKVLIYTAVLIYVLI